jgi:hypothetical protein
MAVSMLILVPAGIAPLPIRQRYRTVVVDHHPRPARVGGTATGPPNPSSCSPTRSGTVGLTARDRVAGGAGLGLTIVDTIAGAHGGKIRALRSSLGGAQLELDIPGFRSDVRPRPYSALTSRQSHATR